MALLKETQFKELAEFHGAHCASIFIPTERVSEGVKESKDRIRFEQEVRAVRDRLKEYGLSDRPIEAMLEPAMKLARDSGFWRRMSDGLAVFIAPDYFEYFTVPVRFESYSYVADHFYVKPLTPLFSGDGRFFILALTLHGAQFYEATRHTITEVYVSDLTPARLEEVVGYDYEEKSLQYRSQGTTVPGSGAVFHGQGRQNDKRKEEVLQYCRAVDKGLLEMLHDEKAPMVVACVDFLFPLYQEANRYKYLVEKNVQGNPEQIDAAALHEKAWERVRPVFERARDEKQRQYDELKHTERASFEVEKIVPAAIHGRVDTLFLQNRADIFGTYDPAANAVEVEDEKNISNASLLNLAAVKTLLQKGQVYLVEPEDMPEEGTLANAVFRF